MEKLAALTVGQMLTIEAREDAVVAQQVEALLQR
jgi:hypothetical protein